jgi:hypothetical protein
LSDDKDRREFIPCRKDVRAHKWKDYPANWHNKRCTDTNDTYNATGSSSNKGKVKNIESKVNRIMVQKMLVRFKEFNMKPDNKSVTSSNSLFGKLMKIATSSAKIKILYKITILVLIDKDRQ